MMIFTVKSQLIFTLKKKKKRFNANNAYTIFNCEVGRNENLEIFYDINIIKIQMYCY